MAERHKMMNMIFHFSIIKNGENYVKISTAWNVANFSQLLTETIFECDLLQRAMFWEEILDMMSLCIVG